MICAWELKSKREGFVDSQACKLLANKYYFPSDFFLWDLYFLSVFFILRKCGKELFHFSFEEMGVDSVTLNPILPTTFFSCFLIT